MAQKELSLDSTCFLALNDTPDPDMVERFRIMDSDNEPLRKYLDIPTSPDAAGGIACMHKNCPGCKNGTCSGVHMLSCPCRSCSPWC